MEVGEGGGSGIDDGDEEKKDEKKECEDVCWNMSWKWLNVKRYKMLSRAFDFVVQARMQSLLTPYFYKIDGRCKADEDEKNWRRM